MIGQWVYVKLSEKHEMQTLIMRGRIIGMSVAVVAFLISLINGTEIIWQILLIVKIIAGGYSVFVNPYLLLVADEDEMINNTRREGMFLGTNAIFNKIAESIGPILAVAILVLFDFVPNAPEGYFPVENTLIGIKFLLFIVPCIFDLLGMVALKFYPLKGESLVKLQSYIDESHRAKKEQYLESGKDVSKL